MEVVTLPALADVAVLIGDERATLLVTTRVAGRVVAWIDTCFHGGSQREDGDNSLGWHGSAMTMITYWR